MIVLNDCMIEDQSLSTTLQKLTFILHYEPAVGKKMYTNGINFKDNRIMYCLIGNTTKLYYYNAPLPKQDCIEKFKAHLHTLFNFIDF